MIFYVRLSPKNGGSSVKCEFLVATAPSSIEDSGMYLSVVRSISSSTTIENPLLAPGEAKEIALNHGRRFAESCERPLIFSTAFDRSKLSLML
jgi:hypothetical protein